MTPSDFKVTKNAG